MNKTKKFINDNTGIGVVEIILILVVLIGLVILFQEQIQELVTNIFSTITTKSGQIK